MIVAKIVDFVEMQFAIVGKQISPVVLIVCLVVMVFALQIAEKISGYALLIVIPVGMVFVIVNMVKVRLVVVVIVEVVVVMEHAIVMRIMETVLLIAIRVGILFVIPEKQYQIAVVIVVIAGMRYAPVGKISAIAVWIVQYAEMEHVILLVENRSRIVV